MRLTILLAILLGSITANAQFTRSITLEPIVKQGWRYYYDHKRVLTPYALQIPLEAIEDEEVSTGFRRFRGYQRLRSIGWLGALVFLFSGDPFINSETFLIVWGSAFATDLTFNLLGHHQLGKAIYRYNMQILVKPQGSLGSSYRNGPQLGLVYRFP